MSQGNLFSQPPAPRRGHIVGIESREGIVYHRTTDGGRVGHMLGATIADGFDQEGRLTRRIRLRVKIGYVPPEEETP
ncbi:MAG: hypothetical protein KatS3mg051_2098 [Anaerolineae bacterium]|nr:MAG: hypothetical protein KatS3mg051_2075 [Anaerolineae bacterium]GIV82744.1 MAG: hypothetical protein KatS3mg051_2098 [Anaerolineae bacterium]